MSEKLGAYKEHNGIKSSLLSTIYNSQSLGKFETAWHDMIMKYDLGCNDSLSSLYNERYHWVSYFVNNSFLPGISTIQRSESMNAFFDWYVTSKTTLKQFVGNLIMLCKVKLKKNHKKM